MFAIDAQARTGNLDHAARHVLRLDRARPLLDLLKHEIEAARVDALPSRALGKAARYIVALWRTLTRFVEYPELELSNNLAANSMRPLVVGPKERDPHRQSIRRSRSGVILSIVESCRRLRIPIRD
jgi:transposase